MHHDIADEDEIYYLNNESARESFPNNALNASNPLLQFPNKVKTDIFKGMTILTHGIKLESLYTEGSEKMWRVYLCKWLYWI